MPREKPSLKRLDPGPAFRLLCRNTGTFLRCCRCNVAQRRGVRESLRYGVTGVVLAAAVLWFVIAA